MYVLIGVFDNEDDANAALVRIQPYVEMSHLQADVPDGASVLIREGDSTLFEQEVVEDEDDDFDDEDDDFDDDDPEED